MNYKYQASLLELKEVHELPEGWSKNNLIKLLECIEYDDIDSIPDEDLKEMTIMALSDLDLKEATVKTLETRLGDKLTKGQRENLSQELREERLWEEYGEISFHEELFNVSTMLYWAFPKKFHEPDIVHIKVKVNALNTQSAINLQQPTPSFLARLLNDGMDNHNIIHRLFDDQMATNKFPESEHIIWKFEESGFIAESKTNIFTIYTSWNWVDELKGVESWESKAFSDGQL